MTKVKRILVSWVGHADLRGLAAADPGSASRVVKATGRPVPEKQEAVGPIHSAVNCFEFDRVHLIGDVDLQLLRRMGTWLGVKTKVHKASLEDPTDYAAVYAAAEQVFAAIAKPNKGPRPELWIALSSGTPAMAATLVLLGKTRYPARFIQTHMGQAREELIPFDLTMEYLPEILRDPDAALQTLADKSPSDIEGFAGIAGNSQAIRLAVGRAKRIAIRDISVLVLGDSGVGKELFARAIHEASLRRDKPFISINCAAIPPELQESELFGHKKDAFTGASKERKGAFRVAEGGTLFLDEFGELNPRTQAALLRALQPGLGEPSCLRTFRPVGADKDETANVRLIAATNQDPYQLIEERRLRDDLFYRIACMTLTVPSLRDRRSDIPLIASVLMDRINKEFSEAEPGYEHKSVSGAAKGFVSRCVWPGNVRQLNNALVQAAVMSDANTIGVSDIRAALAQAPGEKEGREDPLALPLGADFCLEKHLGMVQRHYLERAMHEAKGIKIRAADLLGIKNYQTLDAQLKRLKVEGPDA